MKPFAIECRLDSHYPSGGVVQGTWMKWNTYKTLGGLLDAWNHWKKVEWKSEWMRPSNVNYIHDHYLIWNFRPAHYHGESHYNIKRHDLSKIPTH